MSSNILAGERRWASARRTGMTVLGKVAVPKPLNLPSQKLENHGMDPNVDIVPKGSIGWGSRPSSSASNPWGSSPTAEGGRPSSSGSRPSTAGSEITHDHGGTGNAWGPSSRPSSASGIPASNQISLTSLRPNSAETRPASSQMSRFAEQNTDNVVAHHPAVSSERAGSASSSDKERFSLTTGDFPTLNSADSFLKSSDLRDQGSHSCPSSASGGATKKDNNSDISQPDVDNGTVNAWKRDLHRNKDEMHPRMDNWQGEPLRYHNPNERPPHFDGWRGPSMNHPGVWYQGLPPGPPPYGPPPGGFPVEPPPGPPPYGPPPGGYPVEPPPPFSFYCPRVPPSGSPNSQPVPPTNRPGGPMGHPKNGELYRSSPIPDAFIRPGMPFRPGFYPMPFEGYYGPPPMGYCNPNELEVQFNGMPPGPHAYNRYPDPSKHSSGNNKRFSEKAEPNHYNDAQEHVILKKHMETKQNYPSPMKRRSHQPGMASRTKEWGGADYDNEDDMYSRRAPHGNFHSSGPADARGGSDSLTIRSGPYGSGDNVPPVDTIHLKKLEMATSPLSRDGGGGGRGVPTLLQKIEGLNEKVRTSDGRNESSHSSKWDEQKGTTGAAIIGEITVPLVDKASHVTAAPRRGYGVGGGKTADYNKQNFNGPDEADGWQKKLANSVQPSDISSASNYHENKTDTTVVVVAQDLPEDREVVDATDTQMQRLKMREMVKQRALQLQQEEEERTREQKAKALAKLEELNRRNNNTSIQKDEIVKTHYESSRTTGGGEWGAEVVEEVEPPFEPPPKTTTMLDTPSLPLKEEPPLTDGGGDRDCIVSSQSNEVTNNKQKKNGGVAPRDVGPGFDSKMPDVLHVEVESSSLQQQRRRSNKNTKNKQNKTDDFQSTGANVTKPPPPEVSIQAGDGGGAQGGGSGINHHHHHHLQKPQKSSRFGRNQQSSARFSDKYHGNDNVVWAPVHSQIKTDSATTETGSKSVEESAISAKNEDQVQNYNTKNKRAEMERYVPKPVAKELAQQSILNPDEVAEKVEPEFNSSENVGAFKESPVEDLKQNNNQQQTKAAGGWRQRQRGSTSSFKSNSRNQESMESELTNTKTEEFKKPDASDDARKTWNDSGAENKTGRGKRHVLKGERSTRNDGEHEKNSSGSIQKPDYKTHTQLQDPKLNQLIVKTSSSKENRGFEDRPSSSHWQPKSNLTQNLVGGGGVPEEHVSHDVPNVNPLVEGTVSQRREKTVPYSSKGHSTALIEDESGLGGSDQSQSQIKQQHFSSDYRRGGRYQYARSGPNRDFHKDLNHERHGQNIHYEYQPIPGKKNEKRLENSEENDGSHDVGPSYKERGGGQHSRRGGGRGQFHGRQSSGNNNNNVQVGAGYN